MRTWSAREQKSVLKPVVMRMTEITKRMKVLVQES